MYSSHHSPTALNLRAELHWKLEIAVEYRSLKKMVYLNFMADALDATGPAAAGLMYCNGISSTPPLDCIPSVRALEERIVDTRNNRLGFEIPKISLKWLARCREGVYISLGGSVLFSKYRR